MHRVIQKYKSTLLSALFVFVSIMPLAFAYAPQAAAAGVCSASSICSTTADIVKPPAANCAKLTSCDLITKYIDPLIKFLTALVGVAVVISIIIAGIQYSSSEGDPGKASAAKNRIRNSIIALVVFILLSSMLNFLIPGGLL